MLEVLFTQLRVLGVTEGDRLLVHASYKSLGFSAGLPEAVIETLLAAVGGQGTLLMPALSYESVNAKQPCFDVRNTPSCVGILPELFRKRSGVRRSLHPTHSVAAYGKDAIKMTQSHHLDDTPAGVNSPYRKLRDMGGKILFIGCGLEPNTSMHGVEELIEPPYLFLPGHIAYTCVDENGVTQMLNIRRHNFTREDGSEVIQRYDRIEGILTKDALKRGNLFNADCYLMDARPMWDTAEKMLRKDAVYFVE
jgi:aminoglycoside 3-N-acetyltransferase